jgi:undecaprenyl-diphosphatase
MTIIQSVALAIVQGITEFLPISSSGHLVIFQKIFGLIEPPIAFDIIIHLGTVFAILFFLRHSIQKLISGIILEIKRKKCGENCRLIMLLIIASIPVVIVGFLLKDKIDQIFNSLYLVGVSFLITSIILFLTYLVKQQKKDISQITKKDALFIGLFQALSILPGVSRSGSTISAGIFRKINKEDCFTFSFLLGIIAILGGTMLQVPKIANFSRMEIVQSIIGLFVSTVVGYFALKILKSIIIKGKFYYFGFYCFILGMVILFCAFI